MVVVILPYSVALLEDWIYEEGELLLKFFLFVVVLHGRHDWYRIPRRVPLLERVKRH